jgi:hypothetical protein
MEFIVRGATEFNEPGVFLAFEENEQELKGEYQRLIQGVLDFGLPLLRLAPPTQQQ